MVMPSQWSSQTGFQRSSGAAEVAAGSICPLRRGVAVGFAPMDQVASLVGASGEQPQSEVPRVQRMAVIHPRNVEAPQPNELHYMRPVDNRQAIL